MRERLQAGGVLKGQAVLGAGLASGTGGIEAVKKRVMRSTF